MVERIQLRGACRGYKRGNIFEVRGGAKWEQTSSEYDYQYNYMPAAELDSFGSRGRLKVEGHQDWIEVRKL